MSAGTLHTYSNQACKAKIQNVNYNCLENFDRRNQNIPATRKIIKEIVYSMTYDCVQK